MFSITERALTELSAILFENATEPEHTLRLIGGSGGFALEIDCERNGDQLVQNEFGTIMAIDQWLAETYDGATIDFIDTPNGVQLAVTGREWPEE